MLATRHRALVALSIISVIAAGVTIAAIAQVTFSDIPDDHEYRADIEYAASQGWITGYPNGTFRPDTQLTDQHIVTIMRRVFPEGTRAEYAGFLRWGSEGATQNRTVTGPSVQELKGLPGVTVKLTSCNYNRAGTDVLIWAYVVNSTDYPVTLSYEMTSYEHNTFIRDIFTPRTHAFLGGTRTPTVVSPHSTVDLGIPSLKRGKDPVRCGLKILSYSYDGSPIVTLAEFNVPIDFRAS